MSGYSLKTNTGSNLQPARVLQQPDTIRRSSRGTVPGGVVAIVNEIAIAVSEVSYLPERLFRC